MRVLQKAAFGTELRLAATSFTGSAVKIGSLVETPSIITFNNDTSVEVFVADNTGSTKGFTLIAGKSVIVDTVSDKDQNAETLQWPAGTSFYATGAVGTGTFRIGVVYPT